VSCLSPKCRFLSFALTFGILALSRAAQAKKPEFPHGVSSGEVTESSAVLWTRTDIAATIRLEVSTAADFGGSEVFRQIVRTNEAADFTAKIKIDGLQPATTYYYRWIRGNVDSDVGTFQTAPPASSSTSVQFAFTGDSDGTRVNGEPFYNNFEVLDQARALNPNFFVYLGDTIYSDSEVRESPAQTLDEYRGLYKENREIDRCRICSA
jgi:alkaline phosphatase D